MLIYQAQRRVGAQGIYWTELTTDNLPDAIVRVRAMYAQHGVDCRVISDAGKVVFRARTGDNGSRSRIESKTHAASRQNREFQPVDRPVVGGAYYYDNDVFISEVVYLRKLDRLGWFRGRTSGGVEKNLIASRLREVVMFEVRDEFDDLEVESEGEIS